MPSGRKNAKKRVGGGGVGGQSNALETTPHTHTPVPKCPRGFLTHQRVAAGGLEASPGPCLGLNSVDACNLGRWKCYLLWKPALSTLLCLSPVVVSRTWPAVDGIHWRRVLRKEIGTCWSNMNC